MNPIELNRESWNNGVMSRSVWAQPVDSDTISRARRGEWNVLLTPKTPVPKAWFGNIAGKDFLCLASGGGQQVPIFAAAGACVTSFDLSDAQLQKDRFVAEREQLEVRCVQGDMADLSVFPQASFDLIFHPASNVFAPDLKPVWAGCHRILRPGGALLSGFMNPDLFLFDNDEADRTGQLIVKHRLPYSDLTHLNAAVLESKRRDGEPLEFSHSLDAQIGGQIEAGFVIAGFFEDRWYDDSWNFALHAPICFATRALRV